MEQYRPWTILIYANGNNELQPEMWQSKIMAENAGCHQDVNVILQISREKDELVKIIRPSYSMPQFPVKWIGTRRYLVDNGKSIFLKDLGRINMADPKSLYEFIKWAVTCYPAKNYMLILSGHGYQFVGAMTDYGQRAPFIMGIPEMCAAIDLSCRETGTIIDLLVFDICYFNSVEVMYELGKNTAPVVKNVLTYLLNGPIAGLPWDELIRKVQTNYQYGLTHLINKLSQTANNKDYRLVAIEINRLELLHIKELCNHVASHCLERNDTFGLTELSHSNPPHDSHTFASQIKSSIASLVISHSKNIDANSEFLFVANLPTTDQNKLAVYSKLAFAQDNAWIHLINLTKQYRQFRIQPVYELKPTMLTLGEVYTYISIMNPAFSTEQKQLILQKLIDYKQWKVPSNQVL